jgi:hypothetical protein
MDARVGTRVYHYPRNAAYDMLHGAVSGEYCLEYKIFRREKC